MKKTFLAIALLSFLALGSAQAQTKIAIIDLRKVFDNYYKTKQADTLLKSEAKDLEDQRQEMITNLRKGEEDWKKLLDKANDQSLSADERGKSKQAGEKKLLSLKEDEQTLQQFESSSRAKLAEKQRRKRDLILEEIRAAIQAVAKASAYTMVVDTAAESANNTPVVLYTDPSAKNDITETILGQINAGAPAESSKPAEVKPATKPADVKPATKSK
jgi:outer membrane protein